MLHLGVECSCQNIDKKSKFCYTIGKLSFVKLNGTKLTKPHKKVETKIQFRPINLEYRQN